MVKELAAKIGNMRTAGDFYAVFSDVGSAYANGKITYDEWLTLAGLFNPIRWHFEKRPSDERVMDVYGITADELVLYRKVEDNLNTLTGELALNDLETSIKARNGDDSVLYDLGANFSRFYDPVTAPEE